MFKKAVSVLLVLCFLLGVPFCFEGAVASTVTHFNVSEKEIADMSTYMCGGLGAISGKWYYGTVMSKNGYYNGKMLLADTSNKSELFDPKGTSLWSHLLVDQGWIYRISADKKKGSLDEIKRITISGENESVIATSSGGEIDFIFIYNDSIYYTENNEPEDGPITGKLYRMNLDGSNKKVILNKPVYLPYIIDDKLLYQDDRDRCRLHICDPDGENDSVLIDDLVFTFVTDGNKIFYETHSPKGSFDKYGNHVTDSSAKGIINSYDLRSGKIETVISSDTSNWGLHDGYIYYCNWDDSQRLYVYGIYDGSIDVMSQDKYLEPIVFGSSGMFYDIYDAKDNFKGVGFIYYDTYKTVDLK